MSLQSKLFRGDPKLEAAAVSDQAHIMLGATGPHVKKIQQALNTLNQANLKEDGIYGPKTAAAVLAYKQARNIINRRYQTQADNIVGKMTIAALDRELLGLPDPIVIIGRRGPIPILSFGIFAAPPVAPTAANVSAVIRGNPYVRANALDAGLPPSVPPGHGYEVSVDVIPPLTGSDFIDLEVINNGMGNGFVNIFPKQIQRQTVITVVGSPFSQTEPGHAGKLQIQASLHGKVLAVSNGFSVCAHPKSIIVDANPFRDVDDDTGVGIIVKETIESDSGSLEHLDQVQFAELIEEWRFDDPPYPGSTRPPLILPYQNAIPPQGRVMADIHVVPRPSAGPEGKVQRFQVHKFKCNRCGAIDKPIPFSGFEILHELSQKGREFQDQAMKRPFPWRIQDPDAKTTIDVKSGFGEVSSAIHKPRK